MSKSVLEFLCDKCVENGLPRSIKTCKDMLYSAYTVADVIFTEDDWGIVYQRDVLINGRLIRFYPTQAFPTKHIPKGWTWAWSTVTFVTKELDSASNSLDDQLVEELKERSGYYKLWRK